MSAHNRKTAHFSQMDAAMRRLGTWDPQSVMDSADRVTPVRTVLMNEAIGWR